MCLAIPAKVVEVAEFTAEVDLMGNRKQVNIVLVNEEIKPGDYVLVHAGYALEKVDESIAKETLALLEGVIDESEY